MYDNPISGWKFTYKNMDQLMSETIRRCLETHFPSAVLNIESHYFDTILESKTCEYNLDVGKNLWLNRSRWSRLTKEYVPLGGWLRFKAQCVEILGREARKGATANMLFRDPIRHDKKHRWGGCLMGVTFRGDLDSNPTITFYSRTTYMGYIGLLDAAIAHVMIREIANEFEDVSLKDISFRWHISSMQVHCFKTLPYIFSQPDLMRYLTSRHRDEDVSPTWKNITKWYKKILADWDRYGDTMLEHEKYGPFKRIKRRWMEHMGHSTKNVPPSLLLSELDFSKSI